MSAPSWAQHLIEDDEWVIRTALGNLAYDLESAAEATEAGAARDAMNESAKRYRATLARMDGVVEIRRV
jgi:hypothetical protein